MVIRNYDIRSIHLLTSANSRPPGASSPVLGREKFGRTEGFYLAENEKLRKEASKFIN